MAVGCGLALAILTLERCEGKAVKAKEERQTSHGGVGKRVGKTRKQYYIENAYLNQPLPHTTI